MILYAFDDFVLRIKEILPQKPKNDKRFNYGMQAYTVEPDTKGTRHTDTEYGHQGGIIRTPRGHAKMFVLSGCPY